ncbi:MAG: carbon-nitrogen hydrolase family protein [Deltaproteobacteria bacterium]|nr:carbon-nitrogen hydrolase family protein [Deltaproteobacteria bacterium]
MNIAVVQLTSTEDVAHNLATIRRLVAEAADAGAQVVTLPENALFMRTTPGTRAPMSPLDGPLVAEVRAIAGEHGIWLVLGSYPETSPDPDRYYNSSVVIDGTADGAPVTAVYRKLHLFDVDLPSGESQRESDVIARGEEIVVTELAGVPTGLTICYDLRFPLLYEALVQRGARILTVPAAFTEYTGKDHWLPLLRARAIETQSYVVAPNQFGHHGGGRRTYGKSAIIDPWGTVLCTVADGVGWGMARVDLAHQDRVRAAIPCLMHRHPAVR